MDQVDLNTQLLINSTSFCLLLHPSSSLYLFSMCIIAKDLTRDMPYSCERLVAYMLRAVDVAVVDVVGSIVLMTHVHYRLIQ